MFQPFESDAELLSSQLFGAALDGLGLPMLVIAPDLDRPNPRILFANAAMAELLGCGPGEITGPASRIVQTPRTDPAGMPGLGRSGTRIVNRLEDGTEHAVDCTLTPLRGNQGTLLGWLAVQGGAAPWHEAHAALQASERRQGALVEGIPQLVWRATNEGHWIWSSPQWREYTGLSERESLGQGWLNALHPDDRDPAQVAWAGVSADAKFEMEGRLFNARENRYRWYQSRAIPVLRQGGEVVEWVGTSTDIDDLKRLQHAQQVLVAELQHRTRNLLAVVRNIARRSIPPSPGRDDYDARLAALSRVQGFLSRSSTHAVSLADLVGAELMAAGSGISGRVSARGPEVTLPGEGVQAVALVLHELTTNAVKYGAIAQSAGRLSISWGVEPAGPDEARKLVIEWCESGVAMPGKAQLHRGFGSELITRALPYQLGAETALEFGPDGVRCRIVLPAASFTEGG